MRLPKKNQYYVQDAIEFIESLPAGSIDGIATSPPYNKGFRGRGKKGGQTNWSSSKLMADNYEGHDDNMPPDQYVAWQRCFLEASLEAVGDGGVILYNIGRHIKNLHEDRRQDIVEGFPVRQTIVWNRKSSNNQGGKRPSILPPIYELIYVIAGSEWRLPEQWLGEMRKWGDVWDIPFEIKNPHPAPFPVALAERMVKMVDGLVVDPFAGSGTIGIAAEKVGVSYLLNDQCSSYRTMFQERLASFKTGGPKDGNGNPSLFKAA